MANARERALLSLYDTEFNGKFSNMAVKEALSADFSEKDKRLITQLVYGTVRYKLTLDYIIQKNSNIKLKKMSKFVLLILRMGVYQLYYLDKIPNSAAVNESVKLARRYAGKSSGFVNAVLRASIKNKASLEFPKERLDFLSVKYSFTVDMVEKLSEYPFCEEFLESLNREPVTTVRINRLKGDNFFDDNTRFRPSPLYKYAAYSEGIDISETAAYKNGEITAQDIAAMMPVLALSPKPCDTCVDVCAAPGGKTTHMAELMENKGKIYAFDIHSHKIELIEKNAKRMGISIIFAEQHDAVKPKAELLGKADKVLADVPCSGIGIIRSKPDIKWSKSDVSMLPSLQLEILKSASEYLKPGGELVYSTCTLYKEENEGVVKAFLAQNPDFDLEKIILPEPFARENEGYITLFPNIDNTDGFFMAKIKRCR